MRTKRRHAPKPPRPNPPPARDEAPPPWLPTGDRWNDLPEPIRQAVPRILAPAYRQFVLDARDLAAKYSFVLSPPRAGVTRIDVKCRVKDVQVRLPRRTLP